MKQLWLVIYLLAIPGWNNGPLKQAREHFVAKKYEASISAYRKAMATYPLRSREIRYNIAQCYEQIDSLDRALEFYHQSVNVRNPELASKASNQIGILLLKQEKSRQALSAWKQALKYDPKNETARYNYELLLKRMKPEMDSQAEAPANQSPDPEEAEEDGENNPLPNVDREERRRKIAQWLRQYQRPPSRNDQAKPNQNDTLLLEDARLILDAMRENETKFLQQLRKTAVNKTRPKERPDW